ncbi:hypothetical protein D3C79_1077930 [compost metagenome]
MVIIFDPMLDNEALILCFEPSPIDIIVMTEATPIMMPSIVNKALNLFLCKASNASLIKFDIFMSDVLIIV